MSIKPSPLPSFGQREGGNESFEDVSADEPCAVLFPSSDTLNNYFAHISR
jgi:hypothetical protein